MCESSLSKALLQGLPLYDFRCEVKAAESSRRICAAFGDGSMFERTAQEWFKRFREGNTILEDRPRSGRPTEVMMIASSKQWKPIPTKLRENLLQSWVSHFAIIDHLHAMGNISRLDQWVPHKLSDVQRLLLLCYPAVHHWIP